MLPLQAIHAVFSNGAAARSAVGRLEVAGVPAQNITVSDDPLEPPHHETGEIVVTAQVDSTHYEKALMILSAEGRISL